MIKLDTLLRFPGEETIEREVWFLLNTLSKTWKRKDELKKELIKRNQNLKIQKIFNISILWGGGENEREDFAGGQVVKNLPYKKKKRICLQIQGRQIQSLVGELKSHRLQGN